ncbi:MAG: KH domain-containing protein [Acidimicrobiales bacterium]|jgi:predicted RNA-binding protein YlqC (UPF0109 family)
MDEGSMFEEPDFSRAQPAGSVADDGYEDDDEDAEDALDDEADVDDEADDVEDEAGDVEDDGEDDEEEEDDEDEGEAADREDGDDDLTVNRVHGAAARAVLEHVTRALVDDPDSVVVEVSEGRGGLRFSVHVAQGDMGRLIGRKGRTAQAIRTLVRAAAAGDGTEASVDIVD